MGKRIFVYGLAFTGSRGLFNGFGKAVVKGDNMVSPPKSLILFAHNIA